MAIETLLAQDMHVHSTFSDGHGTLAENIAEAERLAVLDGDS